MVSIIQTVDTRFGYRRLSDAPTTCVICDKPFSAKHEPVSVCSWKHLAGRACALRLQQTTCPGKFSKICCRKVLKIERIDRYQRERLIMRAQIKKAAKACEPIKETPLPPLSQRLYEMFFRK